MFETAPTTTHRTGPPPSRGPGETDETESHTASPDGSAVFTSRRDDSDDRAGGGGGDDAAAPIGSDGSAVADGAERFGEPPSPRVRLAQLTGGAAPRGVPRHAASSAHDTGPAWLRSLTRRARRGLASRSPSGRRLALVGTVVGVLVAGLLVVSALESRPEPERAPPLPTAAHTPSAAPPARTADPADLGTDSGTEPADGVAAAVPGGTGSADTGTRTTQQAESVVVSVVGKVAEPGLITVPAGSRVADAIERAGGARREADLHTVNLARRLSDGEQIYVGVPVPPRVRAAGSGGGGSTDAESGDARADTGPVDLNAADRQRLETLPGVGEVMAQRIVDWRSRHGGFTAVEQLREIDGIGPKRFARLRERVALQ